VCSWQLWKIRDYEKTGLRHSTRQTDLYWLHWALSIGDRAVYLRNIVSSGYVCQFTIIESHLELWTRRIQCRACVWCFNLAIRWSRGRSKVRAIEWWEVCLKIGVSWSLKMVGCWSLNRWDLKSWPQPGHKIGGK